MGTLWASSLVSAQSRQGRVDLADMNEDGTTRWQTQCSTDEARAFALSVLEAAEAAEMDALVVAWLVDEVGVTPLENAVAMLATLRALRVKRRRG
jgi:Trk K+ transport system NAD-binding subunit